MKQAFKLIVVLTVATLVLTNCSSRKERLPASGYYKGGVYQGPSSDAPRKQQGFQVYWREFRDPTGPKSPLRDVLLESLGWMDNENATLTTNIQPPMKIEFIVDIDGKQIASPSVSIDNPAAVKLNGITDGIIQVSIWPGQANMIISADRNSARVAIKGQYSNGLTVQFQITKGV